ncbi:MAG TPA: hypothetical protein VGM80_13240 [Gaiellaceae bacterium]
MEMTPDLELIHERLVRAAHRDLGRRRMRLRLSVAISAVALVTASAAAAVGLGLVRVGSLEISSQPELPPSLATVPAASALAGDPNALACTAGWVAATAVMQSPHEPSTIEGCHTPTDAERVARRDEIIADDPALANPLPYWYLIDEASLAASEGRPGAAAAISPVYVGSATPLTPAELTDPVNWRITVSGVGNLKVPTAPLPAVTSTTPAEAASITTTAAATPAQTTTSQSGGGCRYRVVKFEPKTATHPEIARMRCVH